MGPRTTAFVTLFLAGNAFAETPEPAPPAAAPAAPDGGLAARVARDAAADRVFLARTALIAPAGTVTVDLRAPFYPGALASARGSITDRIEVGVAAAAASKFDPVYGGHLKVQLVRGRRAAVAAAVDVYGGYTFGSADGEPIYAPSLVASVCAGPDCSTLLGAHVTVAAFGGMDHHYVLTGLSFVAGRRRQMLAEIHFGGENEEGNYEHERSVVGGFIGARFPGANLSTDIGLAFGFSQGLHSTSGAPYPFIGFASRL